MSSSTPTPFDRPSQRSAASVALRDAVLIILASAISALAVNSLRRDGIELVAKTEYEILVPCPEPIGTAEAVSPGDERISDAKTLLIDARDSEQFEAWHLPEAISVPLDWLAEQHEIDLQAREVAKRVARSGKRHVVVYGDGGDPDSGQYWAALLSSAGIKRVVYVTGGAAALRGLEPAGGGRHE